MKHFGIDCNSTEDCVEAKDNSPKFHQLFSYQLNTNPTEDALRHPLQRPLSNTTRLSARGEANDLTLFYFCPLGYYQCTPQRHNPVHTEKRPTVMKSNVTNANDQAFAINQLPIFVFSRDRFVSNFAFPPLNSSVSRSAHTNITTAQ